MAPTAERLDRLRICSLSPQAGEGEESSVAPARRHSHVAPCTWTPWHLPSAPSSRVACAMPARRRWMGVASLGAIGVALAISAEAQTAAPLRFDVVAPGVWKATVGSPEDLTLLTAAGVAPKVDALRTMPAAPPPDGDRFERGARRPRQGGAALPAGARRRVYGLGVDFTSMRRTGTTFQLHVDHWGGRPGRTHAPVPFYVSTRGYGVFIDTSRYVTMYVGSGVRLAAAEKPPVDGSHHQPRRTGRRSRAAMRSKRWCPRPASTSTSLPGRRRSMRCVATTCSAAAARCRPSGALAS